MNESATTDPEIMDHLKLGSEEIRQHLYRILTHFHGSGRLTELANLDTGANFQRLQEAFEEPEIHRLLLTVAVRIRILDDAYRETSGDSTANWTVNVGTFLANSTNENESVALSLRETGRSELLEAVRLTSLPGRPLLAVPLQT